MKFEPNRCPRCGDPAIEILERVSADASVVFDGITGEYDYTGGTEVNWDYQETVKQDGKLTLFCPEHHGWQAAKRW